MSFDKLDSSRICWHRLVSHSRTGNGWEQMKRYENVCCLHGQYSFGFRSGARWREPRRSAWCCGTDPKTDSKWAAALCAGLDLFSKHSFCGFFVEDTEALVKDNLLSVFRIAQYYYFSILSVDTLFLDAIILFISSYYFIYILYHITFNNINDDDMMKWSLIVTCEHTVQHTMWTSLLKCA